MTTPFRPVIRSLEENDQYEDNMRRVFLEKHPSAHAKLEFICRCTPVFPLADLADEVNSQLDHLCSLTYSKEALDYKRSQRYLGDDYVDFIEDFQLQRKYITVSVDGPHLRIVAEGPLVKVSGFEIPVSNIVSELYYRRFDQEVALTEGRKRLQAKIATLKEFRKETPRNSPFEFYDFGLRRRFLCAKCPISSKEPRTCISLAGSILSVSGQWAINS
jgi:nicotinate phosphoribosyltransferase